MPEHKIKISWWKIVILTVLSIIALSYLSYVLTREQTVQVQITYMILFTCYILLYRQLQNHLRVGIYISLLLRVILIFSIPMLSDDVYRFIWDGRLLAAGYNPFHEVPEFYMDLSNPIPGISTELYENLNYTIYHTMYPSVPQFTAWVSVLIGGDSIFWNVVVMKIFIITAEVGSMYLMLMLLKDFDLKSGRLLLYSLNPLVIMELSGNLHHEAFLIFFILLSVVLWRKNRIVMSAGAFALAIASKLLPLIFLPLFAIRYQVTGVLKFYLWILLFSIILFLPFLDSGLLNAMKESGWLYFQRFEFNGSVYYLVREAGYMVKGYNIIESAGRWMAVFSFLSILTYSWISGRRKVNMMELLMWIWLIYLVFTTTLHPWYIIPLIAFSIFTNYRFPILWSYLIFLTYFGYSNDSYSEPIILILVEYLLVYGFMVYEILRENDLKNKSS